MSRIAIIGAGNLGAFLAAHLDRAGHEVYFCVRRIVGAVRVEGFAALSVPQYVSEPPAADAVVVTVKTYDTAEAAAWLPALCRDGAPVAVIQNGIRHAEGVHPYEAVPVLAYVYVEGEAGVHRAFSPQREHFTVPGDGRAETFLSVFAGTPITIRREQEFHTAAWRKMLHNCVSNPLTAIAGRGLEILREAPHREWAREILAEGIAIAQADGARFTANEGAAILEVLGSYPAGTRTSMLQDCERGKKLETDALTGTLVELAERYGLPAPRNREVLKMLRLLEGRRA